MLTNLQIQSKKRIEIATMGIKTISFEVLNANINENLYYLHIKLK